jgi:hypothetical protein
MLCGLIRYFITVANVKAQFDSLEQGICVQAAWAEIVVGSAVIPRGSGAYKLAGGGNQFFAFVGLDCGGGQSTNTGEIVSIRVRWSGPSSKIKSVSASMPRL